jgi:aminomethyltransferase
MLTTPLKQVHIELGAKMGEFAGWEVAMNYTSNIEEHMSVRNAIGLFDVSHMGRITIKGKDSTEFLDYVTTKNVLKLSPGKISIPTAMLNYNAGVVDDISLFMLDDKEYLIVCNAINRDKNINWLNKIAKEKNYSIEILDITFKTCMLAIQGRKIKDFEENELNLNIERESFLRNIKVLDCKVEIISKSGWTGESGYELILEIDEGKKLWKKLIEKGIKPCGIITRDSLRLEAGFLLYGNEISEEINPLEARYWIFSLNKGDYIGRKELESLLEKGVEKIRVGLIMKDKGPLPRKGNEIYSGNKKIGYITSGGYSPILEKGIAMGYIHSGFFFLGGTVKIKIRDKMYDSKIAEPPFFKK